MKRRDILKAGLTLAGGGTLASHALAIKTTANTKPLPDLNGRPGTRKLGGKLEVSSIGLGVQNMSLTYQTTIPSRPEMIRIIRAAYDKDVTLFDTAEAYGPFECE